MNTDPEKRFRSAIDWDLDETPPPPERGRWLAVFIVFAVSLVLICATTYARLG